MSTDKTYKLLLQKLIAGTITDQELWSLERASLDDPFLADALEGYYKSQSEEHNLTDLKQKLQTNTSTKTRTFRWRSLSIAASLLLLVGASLWLTRQAYQPMGMSDKVVAEAEPVVIEEESASAEKVLVTDDEADIYSGNKSGSTPEPQAPTKPAANTFKKKKEVTTTAAPPPVKEPVLADNEVVHEEELNIPEIIEEDLAVTKKEKVKTQESRASEQSQKSYTTTARKSKKKAAPLNNMEADETETEEEDIAGFDLNVSQANAAPIERTPIIIKGVVTNEKGLPVPGVKLLDNKNNELGLTDASGNFALSETKGYIIAAFAGYDSTTVALAPNLDIQLQKSSDALSQPLKRLVDVLDDNELIIHYTNKLNSLFSRNWPLCQTGWQNGNAANPTSVSMTIAIDKKGNIEDLHLYRELSPACQEKISNILEESEDSIFETERPITFTMRINL